MNRSTRSLSTAQTPDTTTETPSWDYSVLTKGPWYFSLEQYLMRSSDHQTILLHGYIINARGQVVVLSDFHLILLRDKLESRKFSFSSPAPANPVESLRAADPSEYAKIAIAYAKKADEPGGISSADRQRFVVGPEKIEQARRTLQDDIVATVQIQSGRKALSNKGAGDGGALLTLLRSEISSLEGQQGVAIEALRDQHLAKGLSDYSVTAFGELFDTFIEYNDCLTGSRKLPDSIIAEKMRTVIEDIDLKSEVSLAVEITKAGAAGDITKTRAACELILSNIEAKAVTTRIKDRGKALRVTEAAPVPEAAPPIVPAPPAGGGGAKTDIDPNKKKKRQPVTKWTPALGKCRHCGELGHLNRDCPKRENNSNSENAGGKAKMARFDDDDGDDLCTFINTYGDINFDDLDSPEKLMSAAAAGGRANMARERDDDGRVQRDDDEETIPDEDHPVNGPGLFWAEPLTPGMLSPSPSVEALLDAKLLDRIASAKGDDAVPDLVGNKEVRGTLVVDYNQTPGSGDSLSNVFNGLSSESIALTMPAAPAPIDDALLRQTAPKRKWYVLPSGPIRGIYYGTWNSPDNIRAIAEGVSAAPGMPTSRVATTINVAIVLCSEYGIPCTYRGPHAGPRMENSLIIGKPVPESFSFETLLGEHPNWPMAPVGSISTSADEPTCILPGCDLPRWPGHEYCGRTHAAAHAVLRASNVSAVPPVFALKPLRHAPWAMIGLPVDGSRLLLANVACEPIGLPKALVNTLSWQLRRLYQCSDEEGISAPPRPTQTFTDFRARSPPKGGDANLPGAKVFTAAGFHDGIANYVLTMVDSDGPARDNPLGSYDLTRSVLQVRTSLESIIFFVSDPRSDYAKALSREQGIVNVDADHGLNEDFAIALASLALAPVFTDAQSWAKLHPIKRICDVEVPSCLSFLKDPGQPLESSTSISWNSSKQTSVALSSCEAELMAVLSDVPPPPRAQAKASAGSERPGAPPSGPLLDDTTLVSHLDASSHDAIARALASSGFSDSVITRALSRPVISIMSDDPITSTGRALQGREKTTSTKISSQSIKSRLQRRRLVLDSGCNRSSHNRREDLVNFQPVASVMTDAKGNPSKIEGIGDLPVIASDVNGHARIFLFRNMRCVPEFEDSLISVSQHKKLSGLLFDFEAGMLHVPAADGGDPIVLPMRLDDGMFELDVIVPPEGAFSVDHHARALVARDRRDRRVRFSADAKPADGKRRGARTIVARSGQRARASPWGRHMAPATTASPGGTARVAHAAHHAPRSQSHVTAMSEDDAATTMHRRLLISPKQLRSLHEMVDDMPANASKGSPAPSSFWTEANGTKHAHSGDRYVPSHFGRLVHVDLAGPFKASVNGSYRYLLVCVDDHSRLKRTYPLRHKNDALKAVKMYVAELRAQANVGSDVPVNIAGSIHSDGGGEFISREFREFTDSEGITHTTSPPYTSDLNGVAERAIRTIMEMVRAALISAGAPVTFWPEAARHVSDILNRTTGPPRSTKSSLAVATGGTPRIMSILPFGCRALVCKPRHAIRKETVDYKTWVGINLGKAEKEPGAYVIWIPQHSKTIVSSNVWFDESLMPWRAKGDQRVGPVAPIAAPVDTIGGTHGGLDQADATLDRVSEKEVVNESFASAVSGLPTPGSSSSLVLILFSGQKNRPDGLATFLRRLGFEVELVDNDPKLGGSDLDNILRDDVYEALLARISRGEFFCVFAAPPCSTFSVSRFFESADSADGGPPPVRDRDHVRGLPDLPSGYKRELAKANALVGRTCALLLAAHQSGTKFILENPADRGDLTKADLFLNELHAPLWLMAEVKALQKLTSAGTCTFPFSAFGADVRKDTTLMFSPEFSSWLNPLDGMKSIRDDLKPVGGIKKDGKWASAEAAAYPAQLNFYLAVSIARCKTTPIELAPEIDEKPVHTPEQLEQAVLRKAVLELNETAADSVNNQVAATDDLVAPTRGIPRPPATPVVPRSSPAAPVSAPAVAPDAHDSSELQGYVPFSLDPSSPLDSSPVRRPRHWAMPKSGDRQRQNTRRAVRAGEAAVAPRFSVPGDEDWDLYDGWRDRDQLGRALICRGWDQTDIDSLLESAVDVSNGESVYMAYSAKESSGETIPVDKPPDPKNRREAMDQDAPGWTKSELKELHAHETNTSFIRMNRSDLPRNRKLVKLVWVYKVKRDGTLKSRLCVQGCSQIPGVDFDQTHCATMRSGSLRLLASMAARFGLSLRRWDFVSAYLQGELEDGEVVYTPCPPGHETIGSDGLPQICRVQKPIYGMAQAGRRWQRTLFPWMLEQGFTQLYSDSCVFIKSRTCSDGTLELLLVGCYVDDLAIAHTYAGEGSLYAEFTTALEARWKAEDEGEISDLLAIEFELKDGSVKLHQQSYIEKLVKTYGSDSDLPSSQGIRTPCSDDIAQAVSDCLADADERTPESIREFQSIVGALLYCATNTRPDIAYAVGMLCRCMSKPSPRLMREARLVLLYLERTKSYGLTYKADQEELFGMSDSDWAVKHSTTGWGFMYNMALISWNSSKQTSVALSSCEAEIMAASEAAKEAKFLLQYLTELKLIGPNPIELYVDNQAARDLAYNPEHHKRTKHIDRRHFFVRELVERNQLSVPFVETAYNFADFFTKALPSKTFVYMRDRIMNIPAERESSTKPA